MPPKDYLSIPHPLPTPSSITRSQVIELSGTYEKVAAQLKPRPGKRAPPKPPEPLEALDAFRWKELPNTLKRRGDTGKGAYLEKSELERLMSWKLHRGTFRPTLPGLIKSNPPELVKSATSSGLSTLQSTLSELSTKSSSKIPPSPPEPRAALDQVCALKGVGPATASLILSCAAPENVPFFGDEVYAWFFGERPAKYDKKEWKSLWAAAWELRARLGKEAENVEARDVERAATVLYWAAEGRLESVAGASEGEKEKKGKGKVGGEQAVEKKDNVKPKRGKKRASTSSRESEVVEEPKKRRRR